MAESNMDERRAKRLTRREEQRKNNVVRADQMHLARLSASGFNQQCNIALPDALELTLAALAGTTGMGQCFYPSDSPSKDWFPYYASQFGTVELNAPFYSWPTVATVKTWIRQAKERDFIYTVKVCELITHTRRFIDTARLMQDFGFIADLLGPRMGCFLYQLPPSIRYTPGLLKQIVNQLEPGRRNVVEFRHKSWWNEAVYAAFRKAGIIFCSCSGPKLPDELVRTSDDIYIRFHGTQQWYRHDYSIEELARWVTRIRESGAKRVWAYFNNDHDCFAPKNALELIGLLGRPFSSASSQL